MIKKEKKPKKKKLRRVNLSRLMGISFLPSVFTLFNLFLGFAALKNIITHNYVMAAYLIVISVIMDGFDGTVARLTKTESDFGMQLDSLVDSISFGLVPAFLIYSWGFTNNITNNAIKINYGKLGIVVGFIYVSAGVIRLARFNVYKNANAFPSNVFIGLPIPGAALAILSIVLFSEKYLSTKPNYFHVFFAVYSLIVAYLMISNVKYRTVKKINSKHSLLALFILASIIASAILFPNEAIPTITSLYLISPVLFAIFSKRSENVSDELED
jgi:CDP-diacylglycerol--serine O-phosphatidyltransferase